MVTACTYVLVSLSYKANEHCLYTLLAEKGRITLKEVTQCSINYHSTQNFTALSNLCYGYGTVMNTSSSKECNFIQNCQDWGFFQCRAEQYLCLICCITFWKKGSALALHRITASKYKECKSNLDCQTQPLEYWFPHSIFISIKVSYWVSVYNVGSSCNHMKRKHLPCCSRLQSKTQHTYTLLNFHCNCW